jgi:hypothetical protein
MLDGAWWPKSRNPQAELPELILAIDGRRGRVIRLILADMGWDEHPRRIAAAGRMITIEFFSTQPANLLTAICAGSRVDLLVVPPTVGHRVARAAMLDASSDGNRVFATRQATSPDRGLQAWHSAWGAAQKDESHKPPLDRWLPLRHVQGLGK